jgi:hypothetical protein
MSPIEGFPTTAEDWYERTGREAGTVRFKYDPKYKWGHFAWILASFVVVSLALVYFQGLSWVVVPVIVVVALLVIGISAIIFGVLNRRVIEIDYNHSVVRLSYFIYPIQTIDIQPKQEVIVPFNQIHSIWTISGRGQSTTFVHTKESRFVIHDCFHNRFELIKRLEMIAQDGEQPVNKPIVGKLIAIVVIVFVVAGVLIAADALGIV